MSPFGSLRAIRRGELGLSPPPKAGPGPKRADITAGALCEVAALRYAEMASMLPDAASAYSYSSATMGEYLAWTVGWALVREYGIAAAAVTVGCSG